MEQRIKNQIENHKIVLYMKGTPDFPQCGFSGDVVHILKQCQVDFNSADVKAVNVLKDEAIRQGIKTFSNWPTIPQLYIEGVFIGGCDIVSELYNNSELEDLLN